MASPEQQAGPEGNEVAKLFQNVGQGLLLIRQYVANVAPNAQPMVDGLLQGYEQLVAEVGEARQGGGAQAAGGPRPQEAGAADVRQAF